ncbi:hypothetical protein BT69DRAFT_1282293 [Atractiella rhizophila]|nr:hypothetical protein BT69DRAFT_1282293 [Atractiella rhizophila]
MPTPFPPSDPWARANAWRKHPVFNRRAMMSQVFPGFGLGLGAFAIYVAYDTLRPRTGKVEHH